MPTSWLFSGLQVLVVVVPTLVNIICTSSNLTNNLPFMDVEGGVQVKNHGIPENLINKTLSTVREFCKLPESE